VITRRTIEEAFGLGSKAALRLIKMLPGARQATLPGGAVQWVVDDDSLLDSITDDMIAEAKAVAQTPGGGGAAAPPITRIVAEDPEVLADRKRLERERLEVERLKAEADRVRHEAELRRLRGDGRDRDDMTPLVSQLIERLDQRPDPAAEALRREVEDLRRRLEAATAGPRTAEIVLELTKALGPTLTAVVNRLATPPTPATPPMGPQDLVALAKNLKDLLGPASGVGDLKTAFREGIELGVMKSEAAAETGTVVGETPWWGPLLDAGTRLLNNVAGHPMAAQVAMSLLQRLVTASAAPAPVPAGLPASVPVPSGRPSGAMPPVDKVVLGSVFPLDDPRHPDHEAWKAAQVARPMPPSSIEATSTALPSAPPASGPGSASPAELPQDVGIVCKKLEEIGQVGEEQARAKCRALSAFLWGIAETAPPLKALLEGLIDLDEDLATAHLGLIHPALAHPKLRPGIARLLAFERGEAAREEAEGTGGRPAD
jgi:hypothetical protein